MLCDYHLHSNFSGDCDTNPEDMILKAISLGMPAMCFTDHYDMDFPEEPELFLFDLDHYFETMKKLQKKYANKIQIQIGIELGLQEHLSNQCHDLVQAYPFDFVIGSSHLLYGKDPYYPDFFNEKEEETCYLDYFKSILTNLNAFDNFDVYGHLDYIVRYGPNKATYYSYEKYNEVLDNILKTCIQKNIGIELNTGGLAYNLGFPNPHPDILRRYKELGGQIITIGSDAHTPQRLAYEFQQTKQILKNCGFTKYTIFKNRQPNFVSL